MVDVNGDEYLDLMMIGSPVLFGVVTVQLHLGNGDGTFQSHVSYAAGGGPTAIAMGDFNGDTFPDAATVNSSFGAVLVNDRVCGLADPRLVQLQGCDAAPGGGAPLGIFPPGPSTPVLWHLGDPNRRENRLGPDLRKPPVAKSSSDGQDRYQPDRQAPEPTEPVREAADGSLVGDAVAGPAPLGGHRS